MRSFAVLMFAGFVLLLASPSAQALPMGVAVGVAVGENEECIELGAECDFNSAPPLPIPSNSFNEVRVAATVAGYSTCVSTAGPCSASEILDIVWLKASK